MAYREKVWNANVLTDLLSTYLTHKSAEREKYYQAELKRKPTYKAFGNELVKIGPDGQTLETVKRKPPVPGKLNTLYPVDVSSDLSPINIRDINGRAHHVDPKNPAAGYVPVPFDVLGKYKSDASKTSSIIPYVTWHRDTNEGVEEISVLKGNMPPKKEGEAGWIRGRPTTSSTTPYVTWNRVVDGKSEETSVLKGQKPSGEGWSVGQGISSITPYVTWNRMVDGKSEETSVLKGQKPSGEGWSVGQATKATTLPYVTWNRMVDGKSEETSVLKGEKPDGEGWSVGQATKATTLPYVTWNRIVDGKPEEISVLKGDKPTGEGWSVGQATKQTTLPYVTWNRTVNGKSEETSVLKGEKPMGEGWSVGQGKAKTYNIGDLKEFKIDDKVGGQKVAMGVYTGNANDTIGNISGWKIGTRADRFRKIEEKGAYKKGQIVQVPNAEGTVDVYQYEGPEHSELNAPVGFKSLRTVPRWKSTDDTVSFFTYYNRTTNEPIMVRKQGNKVQTPAGDGIWKDVDMSQVITNQLSTATTTPENYNKMVGEMIAQTESTYPGIGSFIADIKGVSKEIDSKHEYNLFKQDLGKTVTNYISNKKQTAVREARKRIAGLKEDYTRMAGDITVFTDKDIDARDRKIRAVEKHALQLYLRPFGKGGKRVYVEEDAIQLKKDYKLHLARIMQAETDPVKKEQQKLMLGNVDKQSFDNMSDEIDAINNILLADGKAEMPFFIHRNRFAGFNEFMLAIENLQLPMPVPEIIPAKNNPSK